MAEFAPSRANSMLVWFHLALSVALLCVLGGGLASSALAQDSTPPEVLPAENGPAVLPRVIELSSPTPLSGSGPEPGVADLGQWSIVSPSWANPGRGIHQDWRPASPGAWSAWSPDGFRSMPVRTFPNGSRLRLTQQTGGWSAEGWASGDDTLNDAIRESASTRLALQWQQRLGRRFELRLDIGAGTQIDASGETRIQMGTSAALVWWFSRNWGLALQGGWMLQTPPVFGREDRIDYRQEFENETPWDDRQTPDVGEALNRFFWGLTPVHRD